MAAGGKRGGAAKLRKELERFHKDPPDHIQVAVNERDMFEWHYLLEGPDDTPYAGNLLPPPVDVCARSFVTALLDRLPAPASVSSPVTGMLLNVNASHGLRLPPANGGPDAVDSSAAFPVCLGSDLGAAEQEPEPPMQTNMQRFTPLQGGGITASSSSRLITLSRRPAS